MAIGTERNSIEATWDKLYQTKSLHGLCKSVGCDVQLVHTLQGLVKRLKNLKVVIYDFDAFQKKIENFMEHIEDYRNDPRKQSNHYLGNDELNSKVIEVYKNYELTLKVLNDNIQIHLPWEIEVHSISRIPVDTNDFTNALDILMSTITTPDLFSDPNECRTIVGYICEIQYQLGKDIKQASIDVYVSNLTSNISHHFFGFDNPKMKMIFELFCNLNSNECDYTSKYLDSMNIYYLTEDAKKYVDNPWMHNPHFHQRYIHRLLDREVAVGFPSMPWWPVSAFYVALIGLSHYFYIKWLALIAWILGVGYVFSVVVPIFVKRRRAIPLLYIKEEVSKGNYYGPEIAGRLKRLESKGIFVSTLLLAILERPALTSP